MELTYLGTAAAEGFPALFCRCRHCEEGRRLGGKNIRTRSQALVNRDLLIDFPADTYWHMRQYGIEADAIPYLLLTHAHPDHLYTGDLLMRHTPYAHDMRAPALRILCSEAVSERLRAPLFGVEVTPIAPFETVALGDYRITALPARHAAAGEALLYLIRGERTLLYAHDTGYPYEEVLTYLEGEHLALDMISLDCTNGDLPIPDTGSHMGFPNIGRLLARLRKSGVVTDRTVAYVNHFSHNARPLQDELEARAREYGCHVAYDGCRVSF